MASLLQAFNMEHRASRAGLARDAHCMDFSKPQMIISLPDASLALPDAATENAGKGFWKMQRTNKHQEISEQGGEGQGCSVLGTVLRICFDLPNVRALLAISLPRRVVPSRFSLIVCTSLGFVKSRRGMLICGRSASPRHREPYPSLGLFVQVRAGPRARFPPTPGGDSPARH